MNAIANIIGYFADLLYMAGAWLNNIAVRIKINNYADNHPSGDRFETN